MSDVILLEKNGPIATLTLNRPDILNPLGQAGDGEAVRAVCQEIELRHSDGGWPRLFRRRRREGHEGALGRIRRQPL